MLRSLRCVDLCRQPSVDVTVLAGLPFRMAQDEEDRKALGERLATARKQAGYTLESAAAELTLQGHKVGKQAVGAWEKGRNLPDSIWLKRLAKLYETTADALLWDDSITMEAIRFAVQYDALNDKQQRAFKAMWLAYFEQAKSDADVGEHISPAPTNGAKKGSKQQK